MRRIISEIIAISVVVVALIFPSSTIVGQIPASFKYQAVVRDVYGEILPGQNVGVKIRLLQNSPDGNSVYEETYSATTNNFGILNLDIGSADTAYFASIDWGVGPYFIEISMDVNGGTNYELYGTSQLMSVPYALYALHAKTAEHSVDTLYVTDTTNQSSGGTFIANVVEDYGAVGDGVTSDVVAFSTAFAENNDVFVPASDNNYLITSLTIPSGKRLWFERGAKLDITGTFTGDNTEIIAGNYQIFTSTSTLAGTWRGGIAYDEWLSPPGQIPGMTAMVTPADTTRWGEHITISDSVYDVSWNGSLDAATKNAIYDKFESVLTDMTSSFIANVVEDYGATGDGTTDDATAFSNAFNDNNDVFVPASANNYLISSLTIPPGKRLWFERGAELDVTGTITGDNTEIIAGNYQILTGTSTLAGTWKSGIAYDGWLSPGGQIPGMIAMVTPADTTRWGVQVTVSDSAYSDTWDGNLEAATKNVLYNKFENILSSINSSFIANVVEDYGATGDGTTDDATAFSNAFNDNNDVFVPASANNYLISSLTIPPGKRLWFERGAKLDVTGTITGDSTEILAGNYQIFTGTSTLAGTWRSGIAYDGWISPGGQIPGMIAMVTPADTTRWGQYVTVSDSAYNNTWNGSMDAPTKNAVYDKIENLAFSGTSDSGSSFIANVVDDYGAIGDGTTDNTQVFINALNENNGLFIPQSDSTYVISNLIIPSGKRLWFERGAKLDVTGTITGDTTEIVAGNYQIFTGSSTLAGTWRSGIAYDGWISPGGQIPGMIAMVTPADTTRWGEHVTVSDSAYDTTWNDNMAVPTKNAIYDKIQSITSLNTSNGGSSFIANVVDDYGAVGDGTTDNTPAFANALNENNDVFIPQADSAYLISNLIIPPGKRLWFERGAMLDITGTLTGDTTEIIAGDYQIFSSNSTLAGSWKGGIAYDSWLGTNEQIPGMYAMVTPSDTARWGKDTFGGGSFIANVIDYGAVSDGITDNTLVFNNALQDNNDIFIPHGDSSYLISSLTIPPGKRLWFETNAKLDVTGTLTGDSTEIMAGDQQLFTATSTLNGTWKSGISYNSWSGKNAQIPGMTAMVSPADTTRWAIDTYGSGSFIANVIDYGAVGDGTTEDSAAFAQALATNNDVFIPNTGHTYKISKLTIPRGKRIWFETGAVLDVKKELDISGEINAGIQQIFTISSAGKINADSAIYKESYPEWFGANGNGYKSYATNNRKAFQAVVDVFPKNVKVNGNKYIIDSTIQLPPDINMEFAGFVKDMVSVNNNHYGVLETVRGSNYPVLKITKGGFNLRNISIYIPYSSTNPHTAFVIDAEFDEPAINPIYHRLPSIIDGLSINTGLPSPTVDGPGKRYNGLKLDVREESVTGHSSADYFSHFNNITMVGADTAIYLSGDSKDLGHVNSEYFNGFIADKCLHAIVIDEMSRGNVFDNVDIQVDYRTPNQPWQKTTLIDIKSFGNKFSNVNFDDVGTGMDSAIIFRQMGPIPGGTGNVYCSDNRIICSNTMQDKVTYQELGSIGFSNDRRMSNRVGYTTQWKYINVAGFRYYTPISNTVDGGSLGLKIDGKTMLNDITTIKANTSNPILKVRQLTGAYTSKRPVIELTAEATTGSMSGSFGPGIKAKIKDDGVDSDQTIGGLYFERDGADNEGKFEIYNGTNGGELRYSIDKNGVHTLTDVLRLTPRTGPPSSPTLGMLYVNSNDKHIYFYNGTSWGRLD